MTEDELMRAYGLDPLDRAALVERLSGDAPPAPAVAAIDDRRIVFGEIPSFDVRVVGADTPVPVGGRRLA